jgi:hypothetical protein
MTHRTGLAVALAVAVALLVAAWLRAPGAAREQEACKSRSLRPEQRADDLVMRMTLDEKTGQTTQADGGSLKRRYASDAD